MPATALASGFADAPREAQEVFKAVMWALARPGLPVPLRTRLAPPAPLSPDMAAIALALLDYETPVWLDPALAAAPAVAAFLRFHTSAPLVEAPAAGRFALIADGSALPDFARFALGEPDYPDRSTTLVVQVTTLGEGPIQLEGPGIETRVGFAAAPLPADFSARLAANRQLFPLGVDLILVAPGAVLGLPRSARVIGEA
ncbi:MAG: phosphonate C-P lyase system protein PhnH [Rhizobiales bacterium 24-66-13]|jgi:alpha-D-ribose 1-methylphosphonate 5-triphosphate synthase subunit PhnH|uniref:phosphonate C-P lyase system protein PhnH n=1 Tax=Roseixanthobacter finlandensis TaxID=3119922 RepID=UPI000BDA4677|nr:MAG: phosphonate C-P lyase system protein PhnH [Rhizobiales bacterium 12-66-7]OYZ82054.1 MAG: phosphonate C-P lyase system protein PhnH [Rhizobiales bacterium 24-66-13]OZB05821.1 MAG: phosphonate C-P lyase system protein PhnH [Rhizobiales bacterium 39-66-18]HQS08001.1 phosphonate C-P lyase system protein PhnH [Xanthobacteraceae bacterium]HQS47028.1 phosphonate C-P lyase system protein PhnH [Xanthobacteraceae bacterium]